MSSYLLDTTLVFKNDHRPDACLPHFHTVTEQTPVALPNSLVPKDPAVEETSKINANLWRPFSKGLDSRVGCVLPHLRRGRPMLKIGATILEKARQSAKGDGCQASPRPVFDGEEEDVFQKRREDGILFGGISAAWLVDERHCQKRPGANMNPCHSLQSARARSFRKEGPTAHPPPERPSSIGSIMRVGRGPPDRSRGSGGLKRGWFPNPPDALPGTPSRQRSHGSKGGEIGAKKIAP